MKQDDLLARESDFSDAEIVQLCDAEEIEASTGFVHNLISTAHQALFPSRFLYKPLPSLTNIRILHLRPASFDAPLTGTFSFAAIDSDAHSEYVALSYTWGDPTPTSSLKCDGTTLGIGSNLSSALRHIRSKTEDVKIWIDAICINQNNLPEKSSQVKNMGRVYSRASRVLVWLGLDTPDEQGVLSGKLAFEAAKDIVASYNPNCNDFENWDNLPWTTPLREITCRQWFHRAWTCQEIGLATRATFHVGHSAIDWDILYQAFMFIETKLPKEKREAEAFYTERVTFLYHSFSGTTFRDLLLHARHRAASDPRDKVYSLLSHPAASDPETGQPLIQVDYVKPVALVYSEATILMLRSSGNLDDLSFSHNAGRSWPWPTWVPRWYENPRMSWLLQRKEASRFAACGSYRFGNRLRLSARARERFHLTVPGFMIDTVEESHYMRAGKTWPAWFKWPTQTEHKQFLKDVYLQIEEPARLKIFATKGGLLGIGPSQMYTGDFVTILCGGRVPYILRAEDGDAPFMKARPSHWRVRLVDECYIPGLMNGEIDGLVDSGRTRLEAFKIF